MTILTRAATQADKPFFTWLEEVCMRDYAVALWGTWAPRDRFDTENCRLVVRAGEHVGCVTTNVCPDHIWIDALYIAPQHQRQGVGSSVLRMILTEANVITRPVRLSVLTTNPAFAFYIRHGFRIYEQTPERWYLTTAPPVGDPTCP